MKLFFNKSINNLPINIKTITIDYNFNYIKKNFTIDWYCIRVDFNLLDIFTLLISFFFKLDTNLTSPVSGSVVYGIELGTSLI